MKIGSYTLQPFKPGMPILTLAPLAGVGNWVFRLICARLGARVVGVEFINCRVIPERSRRSERLLDFSDAAVYEDTGMSLLAAQIYGNDITLIARGAAELEQRGTHVIDINFGCSVPQILRKGCGAAYLKDLDLLYAYRVTPWFGPYARGALETNLLYGYQQFDEETDVRKLGPDGEELAIDLAVLEVELAELFAPIEEHAPGYVHEGHHRLRGGSGAGGEQGAAVHL